MLYHRIDEVIITDTQTRIVRGSDYSPASELFSSVRKTMTGNNPKLDLVNADARKKRMVRFCQFILKILSGNEILTSIKGRNALKIYRNIMGNDPKLDIVNVDVHTKFDQILSIHSQDIEWKRNSDVNQGP